MSGVKGRSGTNKNKDKPWSEALRLVVFRDGEDGKRRLLKIAETCALAAETGDMAAIREIGDRLDGKPAQESTMTVTRITAKEMTDSELDDIIARSRAGEEGAEIDPSQLN